MLMSCHQVPVDQEHYHQDQPFPKQLKFHDAYTLMYNRLTLNRAHRGENVLKFPCNIACDSFSNYVYYMYVHVGRIWMIETLIFQANTMHVTVASSQVGKYMHMSPNEQVLYITIHLLYMYSTCIT